MAVVPTTAVLTFGRAFPFVIMWLNSSVIKSLDRDRCNESLVKTRSERVRINWLDDLQRD